MKNIAVILAAGLGKRMGEETPKQFLPLAGKMVLEHAMDAFETHEDIDMIVLVAQKEHFPLLQPLLEKQTKPTMLVEGGEARFHSSLAALEALMRTLPVPEEYNVLIHDAARPMLRKSTLNDCLAALETYDAVCVAVPALDATFMSNDGKHLDAYIARDALYHAQTPQGFKLSLLETAYAFCQQQNMPPEQFHDDCSVFQACFLDLPIALVEGSQKNRKITYQEDLAFLNFMLENA